MKIEEDNRSEEKKVPVQSSLSNKEMFIKMQQQIDDLTKSKATAETMSTAELLTQLVAELKDKPDSEKYGGENTYTRPEDIDPADMLEEGITFFSHQVFYVIADDKRNGHNVRTPFGKPIIFIYQSTRHVKHGNETKLHNVSAYTSFSKKEVQWIREHKFFGTIFFSTHTKAMSIDAIKASRLAKIIITLQRYEVHKIIKMARDLGVEPSEDINGLRIAIANMQAETEMKAEEESNLIRVRESIIEKDILTAPAS